MLKLQRKLFGGKVSEPLPVREGCMIHRHPGHLSQRKGLHGEADRSALGSVMPVSVRSTESPFPDKLQLNYHIIRCDEKKVKLTNKLYHLYNEMI